jgi:hypothetical protein
MPSITYTKNKVAAFWSKIEVVVCEIGNQPRTHAFSAQSPAKRQQTAHSPAKFLSKNVGGFSNDNISRWAHC